VLVFVCQIHPKSYPFLTRAYIFLKHNNVSLLPK
jgi:hypothetical protein